MQVFHLARSPAVDLYNETHPRAFERFHLRPLAQIDQILDRSFAQLVLFKPILDTHKAAQWLEAYALARVLFAFRGFGDVVNSARRYFFEERHKRVNMIPGDVDPPVDRWVRENFAEFSEAPPPESTRESVLALYRQELGLDSKIALRWLFYNSLYFDLGLDRHPRVRLLEYETCVRRPGETFRKTAEFLGIPYRSSMAEGVHAGSVTKRAAPTLDAGVRAACTQLHERLQQAFQHQADFSYAA